MRLIDADALKKDIAENYVFTGFVDLLNDFARAIDGQPTVDAVERKRGEWINDKGLYRCSVCNELWCHWWASVVSIERMNETMHFCPNCGADMRGEPNES